MEIALYLEAITYFLGGEAAVVDHLPILREGRSIGSQRVHLLNSQVAFCLTAINAQQANYESHLRRLLEHTNIIAIQWINMNHHDVELVTVAKP